MAGFEGIEWAGKQLRYTLKDESFSIVDYNDRVVAVSRSTHYGLFLAFEGIRFFCKKNEQGHYQVNFLNLHKNLERFRRSISFGLSAAQQKIVPSMTTLMDLFTRFFKDPDLKSFLAKMASDGVQGYLRPFTFDESLSIGVTFPENPSIRAVVCRYDRYLGEPFTGVVIPHMIRAVGINGTGCLKLGVNYVMSVKAIEAAKKIVPEASSALFLDDRPYDSLGSRKITEWDTSCCLIALKDDIVVKIPESNLILPSITIRGICSILTDMGVSVQEREMTYGELIEHAKKKDLVAICSVGTAGILNRAKRLVLIDEKGEMIGEHQAIEEHPLYASLGQARTTYWDIYREKVPALDCMLLEKIEI